MKPQPLPIKKRLPLHWQGATFSLDVAQDLFSSHQIDRGSRMMLASLESREFAEKGSAADFGCGYGVLGIAWQAAHPGWSMRYVDRDALAVAFAEHNVRLAIPHLADCASYLHDVTPPEPPAGGHDLVLWNVPGKAGDDVLQSLTQLILDGLGMNGLLALVVVNPLAPALRLAARRPDVTCELDEMGREHTVLHLRKTTDAASHQDAFLGGVFDRSPAPFSLGEYSWRMVPVVGLPEYDSMNHATVLAGEAMIEAGRTSVPGRWLIHEPGVGHLAVLAAKLWPGGAGMIASRDALALRSSEQAVEENGAEMKLELRPVWGLGALANTGDSANIAVVAVPDQVQAEELGVLAQALETCVTPDGTVIAQGGSTGIGRLERVLGRSRRWRVGKRRKYRGMAAIPIFLRK